MKMNRNLAADAGRVLMVGLSGPDLTSGEKKSLEQLRPGGVILFRRNLDSPERLAVLMEDLDRLLPAFPWLAVDQEGGSVSRLEPWIGATPSACERASAGPGEAYRFGRETGRQLASLGFNLDFAPVVDLCPPDRPNGIGDRSWGTDPEKVAGLTGRFLDGLHSTGVAGCLKHFPGLGDTAVDSHLELPVCRRDGGMIERVDMLPYRELGPSAPAIMVCHASFPTLDSEEGRPASLSPAIITRYLREQIGFTGMVATDDMEMGAVAPLDVDGSAAVQAIRAGADLLPYCADLNRAGAARDALVREAEADNRFAGRLHQGAVRVLETAGDWPRKFPGR